MHSPDARSYNLRDVGRLLKPHTHTHILLSFHTPSSRSKVDTDARLILFLCYERADRFGEDPISPKILLRIPRSNSSKNTDDPFDFLFSIHRDIDPITLRDRQSIISINHQSLSFNRYSRGISMREKYTPCILRFSPSFLSFSFSKSHRIISLPPMYARSDNSR